MLGTERMCFRAVYSFSNCPWPTIPLWMVSPIWCSLVYLSRLPLAIPVLRGWLPDIVGLLVTGQHHVCNGLLQVLALLPQDVLEVIFQGLYHITQEENSPRQMLSLWEKNEKYFISWVTVSTGLS